MSLEDRVAIRLAGEEIRICESYEVHMGIMTQPSRFAVRLGHAGTVRSLLDRYPIGTPFELLVSIDGKEYRPQFTGRIDARGADGRSSSVTFRGRDVLAQIIRNEAPADKALTGASCEVLLHQIAADARAKGLGAGSIVRADVDRALRTGAVAAPSSSRVKAEVDRVYLEPLVHPPTIKAGDDYFEFLRSHFQKKGLYLFGAAQKGVVVTTPDAEQAPLYGLRNNTGESKSPGTVLDYSFDDDSTDRFSECTVYGRGGGRNEGRTKAVKRLHDEELEELGLYRLRTIVDHRVSSIDEADYTARRRLSEARRQGWSLEYTLAGHTVASRTSTKRLVWARDTVVHVEDPELGIFEPMYIESVSFRGTNDATNTTIRLMRPRDVRFLADLAEKVAA